MVTDYAEGELFQILEDDGSLPEEQVRNKNEKKKQQQKILNENLLSVFKIMLSGYISV